MRIMGTIQGEWHMNRGKKRISVSIGFQPRFSFLLRIVWHLDIDEFTFIHDKSLPREEGFLFYLPQTEFGAYSVFGRDMG